MVPRNSWMTNARQLTGSSLVPTKTHAWSLKKRGMISHIPKREFFLRLPGRKIYNQNIYLVHTDNELDSRRLLLSPLTAQLTGLIVIHTIVAVKFKRLNSPRVPTPGFIGEAFFRGRLYRTYNTFYTTAHPLG